MGIRNLVRTALKGLSTNLGRSLLTMLGIIIGVAAIVLVMSLGKGARELIISQVEGIGGDTIMIRPGRQPEGPTDFADTILADTLTRSDVEALSRSSNVPNVQNIVPAVLVSGAVSYQDAIYRPTIFGWKAEALGDMLNIVPEEGAYFSDQDIRTRAKVAVLGSRVRQELFGESSAVGKRVTVRNASFRVVGVLPKSGQLSFFNPDEIVVIPYSTAQQDILGIDYFHEVMVWVTDPALVNSVADDIRRTLREQHHITDKAKDDFFVVTQEDILERVQTVTTALTMFLSSIAAISLVVGGVGIMNIMLVSVTERTREIGLRKAVGATDADILRQFLLESLMLTVSGGVFGTVIAVALTALMAFVANARFNLAWEFQLPVSSIVLGVGMAAVVGLLFGMYPARQASRKSPIEALRYE